MNATRLLFGADLLGGAARTLAVTTGPEAAVATSAMAREGAAIRMHEGAEIVRRLGGPFFDRMADEMISHAEMAAEGRNVGMAIDSALTGERWLLGRLAHTHG